MLSNLQAIRSVSKNRRVPPSTPEVIYVDVHTDPTSRNQFILWDDIRQVFDDALHVRHQAKAMPFLKGPDYLPLKPFRIAAVPNVVLDVFVSGPMAHAVVAPPQPLGLRQIEQQALGYPRYNPLTTLLPHPYTSQLSIGAPSPVYNKELAHKRVKGAIGKIANPINLDHLTTLHAKGDGLPQDFRQALECYLTSRCQGHTHALICVGDLFLDGRGVTKDSSVAIGWYLKAAYLGDTFAQRKVEALRLQVSRRMVDVARTPSSATTTKDNNLVRNLDLSSTKTADQEVDSTKFKEQISVHNARNQPNTIQTPNGNNSSQPPSSNSFQPPNSDILQTHQVPHNDNLLHPPVDSTVVTMQEFTSTHALACLGDKDAQVAVGDVYRDGRDGVQRDFQRAMSWYLMAADQDDAVGQCRVGDFCRDGHGVSQNYKAAMEWFNRAAHQDHPPAHVSIGLLYLNGQGVSQNIVRAMNCFQRAAAQGCSDAEDCIWKTVEQGHSDAQNHVGQAYRYGLGLPQDFNQAMYWLLKASNQGHFTAQRSIGEMYHYGQGVPKDYLKSLQWYTKVAERGNDEASYYLGELYEKGRGGVIVDYSLAMKWYHKASSQGSYDAQYRIGRMYMMGLGVTKDGLKAMEWFLQAANHGHSDAQKFYSHLYARGYRIKNKT